VVDAQVVDQPTLARQFGQAPQRHLRSPIIAPYSATLSSSGPVSASPGRSSASTSSVGRQGEDGSTHTHW
jgi:hypothetical protein